MTQRSEELNGFFQKGMIPAHPGFEILLRECFGLEPRPIPSFTHFEGRRAQREVHGSALTFLGFAHVCATARSSGNVAG